MGEYFVSAFSVSSGEICFVSKSEFFFTVHVLNSHIKFSAAAAFFAPSRFAQICFKALGTSEDGKPAHGSSAGRCSGAMGIKADETDVANKGCWCD